MASTRVPREQNTFNLWYQNFALNLPSVADLVAVTAAELLRVANDSAAWDFVMLRNAAIRTYKEQESELKETAFTEGNPTGEHLTLPTLDLPELPDGLRINQSMWTWVNKLVQRIVKTDGFTPEIEALLDIEIKDGESDLAPEDRRASIKKVTSFNGGVVVLDCSLQGMKAYRVYSQRGESDVFEPIGDSTQTEFRDERPNLVAGQPETRQYKAILLDKNKPVGDYSPIEQAVTKP